MQRIIFIILCISFSSVCADEKKDRPNNHDGHCDLCGSCQCIRRIPVAKPIMKEVKKYVFIRSVKTWSYRGQLVSVEKSTEVMNVDVFGIRFGNQRGRK